MTAGIVANGAISDVAFVRESLMDCEYLIACDGGLWWFSELGMEPDCIVGDLDSISGSVLVMFDRVPVLRFSAQKEETDLELAVAHACDQGAEDILILGGLGGRFDHQLGNTHVLAQAVRRGITAELRDENTRVWVVNDHCRLHRRDGTLITLFPLGTSAEGIVTEGLRFPLKDESLHAGYARGVSNEINDESAVVSLKNGMLVVIQTREGEE